MGNVARRRIGPSAGAAGRRRSRPRTAFVLSGAASLGALRVGTLRALHECGIEPALLVRSSAGALNAVFIASRPQSADTAAQLARIRRGLQREDVFPVSMSALVGGVWGRRDHGVRDDGLRQLVRRYIEFDDLADASIPGVFPPVPIGERELIDGGVVDNTPISHAVERIFVLPTQDPTADARARGANRTGRRDPRDRTARRQPAEGGRRQVLVRRRADRAPGPQHEPGAADEL